MALSVIVPVSGYERGLADLLSNLYAQCVPMEVLVVEKPDGDRRTRTTVAAWDVPSSGRWRVRHVVQDGGGYGAALALGTRKAQGDLLLYADADVTFPAGLVPEMLALHDVVDVVCVRRRHAVPGISVLADPWIPRTGYVTTWACLVDRDTVRRLGGWRDVFLPDADLWLRARAAHLLFGTTARRVRTHRKVHQETRKLLTLAKMIVSDGHTVPGGPYTRPL